VWSGRATQAHTVYEVIEHKFLNNTTANYSHATQGLKLSLTLSPDTSLAPPLLSLVAIATLVMLVMPMPQPPYP
jgi:hypothetical protein